MITITENRSEALFLLNMSQHDHLLKQLCGSSVETLERARELLYTSTVKTAPGSGFQLKDPLGRPAACALIASEQYASICAFGFLLFS